MTTYPDSSAPFSSEAEEAVLGALLINPNAYFDVVPKLKGDDFFLLRHQRIWQAIERIVERGDEFDYLTVSEELQRMGFLEEIGSSMYLLRLVNAAVTSHHIELYATLVISASTRRRLLTAADEVRSLALSEHLDIEKVVEEAESRIYGVTDEQRSQSHVSHQSEVTQGVYQRIMQAAEARADGEVIYSGLQTHIRNWDDLLNGLERGQMHILAARPKMGKSSLGLGVVRNVAQMLRTDGTPYRVFLSTLEMDADMVTYRHLAAMSGISLHRLRKGDLGEGEGKALAAARDRLNQLDITIDDTKGITPMGLRASLKRATRRDSLDLIVVDYIGLMTPPSKHQRTKNEEIGDLTKALIEFAGEFDCPVLTLSQLSRKLEERADKRPQLSDLRDSGNLEQDAYSVTFIYREEVYKPETAVPGMAEIIVAANRNGPTGSFSSYWNASTTSFVFDGVEHIDLSQ